MGLFAKEEVMTTSGISGDMKYPKNSLASLELYL